MPTASVDGFAQARALTKRYHLGNGSIEALRGVDLCVAQGEFVAIVGPSGCGKSTLLHLLGGLDTPTSGTVYLGGQDLYALDDDALTILRRRSIGFVFQFFHLVPTLTALENVGLPLLIDGQSLARHRAWIEELLRLVGLEHRAHHRPAQLSGGERQRVAIARALVARPQLVLADEPTGNLDSSNGGAILDLLCALRRELNATIVMVTHDRNAARHADRIVTMRDGRVLGDGHQVEAPP